MAKTFKAGIKVGEICHVFDKIQPRSVKVGDSTIDKAHTVLYTRKTSDGQCLARLSGVPGIHRIIMIEVLK